MIMFLSIARRGVLLGLLSLCAITVSAQEAPKKEISEKVSTELGKLRALTEAKDYAGSLQLIDGLLPAVQPESYDLALLAQIKVQILLTDSRYDAAIDPLERALDLGTRYGFFEPKALLDQRYLLSQLYYQKSSESRVPAERAALLEKAHLHIRRWMELSPTPSPEVQLYAASILYAQATLDPGKIDLAKIRQSLAEAEKNLYLQAKPSDQLYVLMLAARQQLGQLEAVADLLELMVLRHPDSAQYWQQLASTYFALAAEMKDPQEVARYHLRSLLTFERAQELGLLNSPRENFSVVALLLTLEQYNRAVALLEKGLEGGSIENTRPNWELLSNSYQQAHQETRAVDALRRAVEHFPQDAQLEFSLAQLHYSLGEIGEARTRLETALGKEGLEKPGQARLFLAYIDYELQRFEEAEKWAGEAAAHPDAKPEDVRRLTRAVRDAIAARSGKS
ncbi:hypothetical protein OpiT1DRAFT_03530 [Opitutaceae bacterium TAV1]|nr:hypothetical protein OpiT1DRAFT_03530 [Opitutaceae bacterium TAV1]